MELTNGNRYVPLSVLVGVLGPVQRAGHSLSNTCRLTLTQSDGR